MSVPSDWTCPVCENAAPPISICSATDEKLRTWTYCTCGHCGSSGIYPLPSAEDLSPYYSEDYYGKRRNKFPTLIEAWINRHRIRKVVLLDALDRSEPRRLLDVGCGSGRFLENAARRGFEIHGVEYPGRAAERAAAVKGLNLSVGSFTGLVLPDRHFTALTMWHVLEHLPDPRAALAQCSRLLAPGGVLVIEVPNGRSVQACLFGPYWLHLDPPRHLTQFTPESLTAAVQEFGFRVEKVQTLQVDMGVYGWMQSMLNGVSRERNLLHEILRSRGRRPPGLFPKVVHLAAAVMLLVPSLLLSLAESLAGRAAVIRLTARRAAVIND